MPQIRLHPVRSRSELRQFVRFPFTLYKGNPYWAPPLIRDEMTTLDPKSNPAFDESEALLLLAKRDGQIVGRIAGIINHFENEQLGRMHARFGWLDFVDDLEVSKALLDAVEQWACEKNICQLKGPEGFTNLDRAGMLTRGFDQPSTFITLYNHPYYPQHLKALGFEKEVDWVEYRIPVPQQIPEQLNRMAELVQQRYRLKSVRLRKKREMLKYKEAFADLLVDTYKALHDFVPFTERQIDWYIKQFMDVLEPDLICLLEDANKRPIAFGIAMPSLTKAAQKANGRLFPFGFIHFLRALKGRNEGVDLLLVGIRPEWRNKGLNALIFRDLLSRFIARGARWAESNPELEDNHNVQNMWRKYNPKLVKQRRIFIKDVQGK